MPFPAERHPDSLSDASVEEVEEEEEEEEVRGGEEGEEEEIEEEADEEVEELEEEEEGNEGEGQEEVEEMEEDPDGKTLEEHDKKVSDVNRDDLRSTVLEKNVISSGQESIPKSLIGKKNDEALLGNRISGESKDIASLDASENEAAADDRPKNGLNGKPEVVIENKEPCLQTHKEFQPPEEVHMTSTQTHQRRPRSSSPDATLENANKRAKIICAFFARGWCIKGNSCRFLHQKDGVVSTSQLTKEEPSGPSRKGDFMAKSGPRQEAERLKPSSSNDALASSNLGSASNSPFSLQRALVRAYGGKNHRLHQFPDNYGPYKSPNASGTLDREEYRGPGNPSLQEKFGRHFDSIDDRHSASKEFIFRKYMDESRLQHEMLKGDCMYDVPCSRGSPLTRNGIVTEHRLHSSGLSTAPSLCQKLGNYYAFERRMEEPVPKDQQSNVPCHVSKSSFGLDSSLNSSFTDPLQPVHVSVLDNCQSGAPTRGSTLHAFERLDNQSGAPTRGSTLHAFEHLDIHGISEFDKGYYGSRSTSLLRNSSPYYSRPKLDTTAQHNVPGDLTDSAVLKTHFQTDAWEPSVPFRSSFCSVPARISSPGSHYDPLLDSIEPSTAGIVNSQTSHRSIVDNVTSKHIDSNPILNKDPSPAYNSQVHPNSFSQPHELFEGKNTSAQRLSGLVTASGPSTGDGKSNIPKKEKSWTPSYVAAGANVSQGDCANTQVDKGRNSKESKSVKIFRAALVEFLKELVKPSWREGHLSKDAHKMVVRKAVEKVLSALQPHQIPSTMESVNQYLSSSRPKLVKLVEGYVEKYAKAGASNVKAV